MSGSDIFIPLDEIFDGRFEEIGLCQYLFTIPTDSDSFGNSVICDDRWNIFILILTGGKAKMEPLERRIRATTSFSRHNHTISNAIMIVIIIDRAIVIFILVITIVIIIIGHDLNFQVQSVLLKNTRNCQTVQREEDNLANLQVHENNCSANFFPARCPMSKEQ